eukprot:554010_1
MVTPEINIYLRCPTSTSRQREIAERFGGRNGMLMKLTNKGTTRSGDLRGFVCGWISTFPDEDEVLFVGGEHPIRISSIIILENASNFGKQFQAFWYFDCMINAYKPGGHYINKIKERDHKILDVLIKYKLGNEKRINELISDETALKYIIDTFNALLLNKTKK